MSMLGNLSAADQAALLGILFDDNPDGVALVNTAGELQINPAGIRSLPGSTAAPDSTPTAEWSAKYGLFLDEKGTAHPPDKLPLVRALVERVTITNHHLYANLPNQPDGRWLSVSATPLSNGGAIAVFRDVTETRRLETTLAKRNAELSAQMEENRTLIERLRLAVDELSTPVLELGDDILALPIVGVVDHTRSTRMTERVLHEVVRRRSQFVIIDITGVEHIDTHIAERLMKLARGIEMLGAECVLCGAQPLVAQSLTDLGISFRGIVMQRSLKRALDYCFAKRQQLPSSIGARGPVGSAT